MSQISAPSKTNVWAHDDGIIPLKKDVEAASPAAADGELYTGGDLFLGEPPENGEIPAAEGDLYTPDPAQGDVYQGDVYQGDVYQGPVAEAAAAEEVPSGVPLRGLIVGIFAGTLAAVLWYTLTVTTHWQFSWVSWLVGIGVAVATVAGTGRGGTDVAVMAAGITALALLLGEFQIAKYFDEQQKVIYEQAENIERDGEYTDREVAMLAGITYEDFADLSDNEKQWVRVLAQLGDEEYEAYGGYDSGEDGSDSVDSTSWQDETLSLGFFLGNLKSFLGFKGLLIWLVGVGSAFRLGMGKMD